MSDDEEIKKREKSNELESVSLSRRDDELPSEERLKSDDDVLADSSEAEEENELREGDAVAAAPPAQKDSRGGGLGWLLAVAALAVGAAGGWFGHKLQAEKAMKAADAAVEGQGDAARGPCKDWEEKICGEFGDASFSCGQAKSSSPILPGSACQLALKAVPDTLTKIHSARTTCESITTKLCAELGAENRACKMVQTDTPTFPPEKCDEIAKNYDQVVAQLKTMEQRGGPGGPPGGSPAGRPGMGGPPPGMRGPSPGMADRPPGHP